jgi:hypothetical protein
MHELVSSSEGKGEENTLGCRHVERARLYQFGHDASPLCLACAVLYRPVLRRAVYIALLVGTILTIINQGDVLLVGVIAPLVLAIDLADLHGTLQRLDLLRLIGEPG